MSELRQQIEKARKAQQENEQKHDVQLELDPATWTIPSDGFADGGTPYTDEELEQDMEKYLNDYTAG